MNHHYPVPIPNEGSLHLPGMERDACGVGFVANSRVKPWEIGLAEVQQVIMLNGLRERVSLRSDGGLRRGTDIINAAILEGWREALGKFIRVQPLRPKPAPVPEPAAEPAVAGK